MPICKMCNTEITPETAHHNYKTVCKICKRERDKRYQQEYAKAGKYPNRNKEQREREKARLDMAEDKPKPKPVESIEDALFRRMLSRAIQSGHEKRYRIRPESFKKAMEY
jgi:DNA-directed RNA polymerase subunit M/transcription elongation factor TFIIS